MQDTFSSQPCVFCIVQIHSSSCCVQSYVIIRIVSSDCHCVAYDISCEYACEQPYVFCTVQIHSSSCRAQSMILVCTVLCHSDYHFMPCMAYQDILSTQPCVFCTVQIRSSSCCARNLRGSGRALSLPAWHACCPLLYFLQCRMLHLSAR